MALTLTAALGVPTTLNQAIRLTITGTVPAAIVPGYQFRLEDEVLELRYFGKTQETALGGAATQTVDDRNVWYAQRGVAGTVIASHALGTAVVGLADALAVGDDEDVPEPFAGGGGTTDHAALTPESREAADQHPASAITGLTLAAVLTGGNDTGAQAITSQDDEFADATVSAAAPSTGANITHSATVVQGGTPADHDVQGLISAGAAGDGNAQTGFLVTAVGMGQAEAKSVATTVDGVADVSRTATASGTGDADARSSATTLSGTAQSGIKAVRNGVESSLLVIVDGAGARLMAVGIPTSDPVNAGQVWLNAGVLMVSEG